MISLKQFIFKLPTLTIFFILLLQVLHINGTVFAWTFDDSTLFLAQPGIPNSPLSAYLRIAFTYPDYVIAGRPFNLGVTLGYVRNQEAIANWIKFHNISVRMFSLNNGIKVANSDDVAFPVITAGGQYSYMFSLTAPTTPGKYLVDLNWNSTYALGNAIYEGDVDLLKDLFYKPNSTDTDKAALLLASRLPPISVEKNEKPTNVSLVIRTKPTLTTQLEPINVTVNQLYPTKSKADNVPFYTTNPYTKHMFPFGSFVAVKISDKIPLSQGIQEKFASWSDGNTSNPRKIKLTSNLELYPIYKIQYLLTINSTCLSGGVCGNPKEPTWYDNFATAPFSVDSPSYFLFLQSFDYWSGDAPHDQTISSHGTLTMDGPKNVIAHWKWDTTYLAGSIGLITALISIFGIIPRIQRRRKSENKNLRTHS